MTFEQILNVIHEHDRRGTLHNIADDFLFSFRDDTDNGAHHASNLLRLKRLARGHDMIPDDSMIETADKFDHWMERMKR